MEEFTLATALDTRTGVSREPVRRAELLGSMVGRRRLWSSDQKLAIVAEAERCDNLTALAKRYDIRTSQLYTWRREFRYAREAARAGDPTPEPFFVPVVSGGSGSGQDVKNVSIEVEMGGAVIRIARTAEVRLVKAVVEALKAT